VLLRVLDRLKIPLSWIWRFECVITFR